MSEVHKIVNSVYHGEWGSSEKVVLPESRPLLIELEAGGVEGAADRPQVLNRSPSPGESQPLEVGLVESEHNESPEGSGSEQNEFVSPSDERYLRNEAYARESQHNKSLPLKLKVRTFAPTKNLMQARSMPVGARPGDYGESTSPVSSDDSQGQASRSKSLRRQERRGKRE